MPNCHKRTVICDLFDKEGKLISSGMNSCSPKDNTCPRLNIVSTKDNYPVDQCNSEHAEARALKNLVGREKPYRSVIRGHSFYCNTCELALLEAGVEVFEIEKI